MLKFHALNHNFFYAENKFHNNIQRGDETFKNTLREFLSLYTLHVFLCLPIFLSAKAITDPRSHGDGSMTFDLFEEFGVGEVC